MYRFDGKEETVVSKTKRTKKRRTQGATKAKTGHPANAQPRIQVDMYDVGLGAGLVIQFRRKSGEVVRILADAGMGPGYQVDGVHQRLPDALATFDVGAGAARIDLIVGTHYDADHLKGLVPIAEDPVLSITEVWLPPLKDDSEDIESDEFLVEKFYRDDTGQVLTDYLSHKQTQVEELRRLELQFVTMLEQHQPDMKRTWLPRYRVSRQHDALSAQLVNLDGNTPSDFEAYFEAHVEEASERVLPLTAHDAARYDSRKPSLRTLASEFLRLSWWTRRSVAPDVNSAVAQDLERARALPAALAEIRKSTASGAITASNLHKVVRALAARPDKPLVACRYIEDGLPRRFVWTPSKRRFIQKAAGGEDEITLQLLGPNESLIDKHREKLPVGSYAMAFMETARIPLESITPSNQLSYIFTLEMEGQRLLISGDAGCYGFSVDGNYYPRLIKQLSPLHVVQVAHHAGHNYDFYNTLLKAGFAAQKPASYLLISHAPQDEKRPSEPFGDFIAACRRSKDEPRLLFTGEPLASKVADYDELICPIPAGSSKAVSGDVRLAYSSTGGGKWMVLKHVVSP